MEGRGGQGEDAWSINIKFDNVHIKLRIIIKLPVNPNFLYLYGGFEVRAKPQASYNLSSKHMGLIRVCMQAYKLPAHFVWATIWVH